MCGQQAVEELLEGEGGGAQPAEGSGAQSAIGSAELGGKLSGSADSSEDKVPAAEGASASRDPPQRSASADAIAAVAVESAADKSAQQPPASFAPSSFPPAGNFPPGLLPQRTGSGGSGGGTTSLFARLRSGHSTLDDATGAAAGGSVGGSASAGTSPRTSANPLGTAAGRPPRPPALGSGRGPSPGLAVGGSTGAATGAQPIGRSKTPDPPTLQASDHLKRKDGACGCTCDAVQRVTEVVKP